MELGYTLDTPFEEKDKWYDDDAISANLSKILNTFLETGDKEVIINIYNPDGKQIDVLNYHMHEILADFYDKLELIEIIDELVDKTKKGKNVWFF